LLSFSVFIIILWLFSTKPACSSKGFLGSIT
jgi:hypothetical protein